MKKSKTISIAFRGGASAGLSYFRVMKELFKKGIFPENISGSSAGAIFAACIACVRDPWLTYKLFLAIQGDKIMKWATEAETGNVSGFGKVMRFIGVAIFNFIPIRSMKKIFKKNFTWEAAKKNGVKKLMIGVVKQKDVLKTLGKEFVNEVKKDGLGDFFDGDGFNDVKMKSSKLIETLPMYFFAADGVYEFANNKLKKISKKVTPLWKVVMASFSNPILPSVRLKFDRWFREKCFDGGIANNYANLAMIGQPNFIQISCMNIPKKLTGREMGIRGVDKIYYNVNRAKPSNAHAVKTKNKYRGFFAFYDANIYKYYRENATRFFKVKK